MGTAMGTAMRTAPAAAAAIALFGLPGLRAAEPGPALSPREMLEHAVLGEEVAWLKMAGWDQYHPPAGY